MSICIFTMPGVGAPRATKQRVFWGVHLFHVHLYIYNAWCWRAPCHEAKGVLGSTSFSCPSVYLQCLVLARPVPRSKGCSGEYIFFMSICIFTMPGVGAPRATKQRVF